MARRQAPLQINKFEGGLNTEFNPLQMPPNISTDEQNMEIARDGSRFKRLGMDYEPNFTLQDTGVGFRSNQLYGRAMFRWDNAGGDSQKSLLVVQIGNYVGIHDLDDTTSISDGLIFSETYPGNTFTNTFNFAVIDGILVAALGRKQIRVYEYDSSGGTVTASNDILFIRDLFGVEASAGGATLTDQSEIKTRPATLPDEHLYNLRNQTFANTYYQNSTETLKDPIEAFNTDHPDSLYPSNADNMNRYIYADPNDTDNRLIERFFSENMVKNSPSAAGAPRGYFVIDALERGASRQIVEAKLRSENDNLTLEVTSLPQDETPGGPTVLESFGGRVWYGGLSADVIGGDLKSPRMSSYVLFSTLVKDRTDITQCYQRADPTSTEDSALVDTDGGFIRLDGAYGIQRMVAIANSLFVFAQNGVWRISGSEGSNFRATSYSVEKVTDFGVVSGGSVVVANNQLYYWGVEGIYMLAQNQFAVWEATNMTQGTIQTFYLDISQEAKRRISAFFDQYDRKIRWVYTLADEDVTYSEELIFDLNYQAFTYNRIPTFTGSLPVVTDPFPVIVAVGESQPYKLSELTDTVTDANIVVTDSGENVTVDLETRSTATRQTIYLIVTDITTDIQYTIGYYYRPEYYDWPLGKLPTDYNAYLIAGDVTGGEARFRKQVPYLNTFFKRTEDGFDVDLNPTNESSCLLSAQWNWTNSTISGKWSTPRQAYRLNKLYFPDNSNDNYDTGDTVIVTRNKIRGWGHSVAFRFEAEPGKNMHIHGWSFDLISNQEE